MSACHLSCRCGVKQVSAARSLAQNAEKTSKPTSNARGPIAGPNHTIKSLALGRMSGRFKHAEGWRRHLHFGFCKAESDPLSKALGRNYLINKSYEQALEDGP